MVTFLKKFIWFFRLCAHRKWNPRLVGAFVSLKLKKLCKVKFNEVDTSSESVVIDVVIPTVSKDLALVEEVIESLRENLKHTISKFYIVTRKTDEMIAFCEKNKYVFVDEVSVLGYGKDKVHYTVHGKDRSGWIFQQLLKLSGDTFVKQKKYFILDSDTILIKPHSFIRGGKDVFLQSEEWNPPYFKSFEKLFGYPTKNTLSYTAHMMLFDTDMLREMKKEIESKHKKSWDKAYLDLIDENENSCASDYDMYANWMEVNHGEKVTFTPFYNTALPRKELLPLYDMIKKYNTKYQSMSFHHYTNKPITTKLKGGLGNQMFQYVMGLTFATRDNRELKLDVTAYMDNGSPARDTPRKYRLHAFNLSGTLATTEEAMKARNPYGILSKGIRFISQRILKRFYTDYDADFLKKEHDYIEGYFQSEKNFISIKDKVFKEFTLKKEFESPVYIEEKAKIDKEKSVSVHIRRGDYVSDQKTNQVHGVCNKDYYDKGIAYIKTKIDSPIFYFFSDDIEWVKNEFGNDPNYRYVSNPKLEDYEELMLMTACANNLIANSSFSWWGAWLNRNPNKLVVAPNRWVNIKPNPQPNIIPEGWTILD